MRRFILPFLEISFVFLITNSTIAKTPTQLLRITSFNSFFLYDETGDRNKIPKNRTPRKQEDFEKIRKTLLNRDPDLIGLQEIENTNAAVKITSSEYECKTTNTPGYSQEVGICWKKTLPSPKIKEVEDISLRPGLRKGLLAEFDFPQGKLSVLSIHLKAGKSRKDQAERKEQIQKLSQILPKLGNFILLGDFNENLESRHFVWEKLQGDLQLRSAGHKKQADCWQHKEGFIDYLITNLEWRKGSFIQTKFESDDGGFDGFPMEEKGLSDHCPITAELIFPIH